MRLRRSVSGLRRKEQSSAENYPTDFGPDVISIIERVTPYTMTSPERINALLTSVDYVTAAGVPGAFVECGVWRGGSMMAAAIRLQSHGVADRELYLFDTFQGMPSPTEHDVDAFGTSAISHMRADVSRSGDVWAAATLDDVRRNMEDTAYPRVVYIEGRVEETIPMQAPPVISLLRLDTDWYESTRHELEHLFPLIAPGGVLIIDDYGHWQGARKAVDEYFGSKPILLVRVDYTGRIAVKQKSG